MTRIAIVGMACRYPDARTPAELWENVLAQRQAFRRIPPERLPLDDYYSPDPDAPDRTYSAHAAVLHDWTFDRSAFRVSEPTYRSTDPAHWLALEVATAAIADCGIALPLERTGVIAGNTLTGDASRAESLRLRWPYVRRAAEAAHVEGAMLRDLERRFKEPFAEITEDSLAGGLSNTIAGRICNYFGFGGGGFTVDGACSSSLLAVTQSCAALLARDVDAAVAGGVDLSLDPFELIGFAKCTALARERMWVYDRKSNGFLPGEGCGFVVLMREEDAHRAALPVYATIAGWGISSDGHGGMTRPERHGQQLALQRAYARAGFDAATVTLFEGHGTGTPIGDPIEIEAIRSLLGNDQRPHYLGSIKANIGHTKAAAGIAGLLKATLAVHYGVVPPTTACSEPRPELNGVLRATATALPWPDDAPRRAAVSAMGFGGINTHVVIEKVWSGVVAGNGFVGDSAAHEHTKAAAAAAALQNAELFLFDGVAEEDVRSTLREVARRAPMLSLAELSDLANALRGRLTGGPWRAAIVASTAEELAVAIERTVVRRVETQPRIAFLFPGQGSPVVADAGACGTRFPTLRLDELWPRIDAIGTALAQPSIVAASLAALRVLRHLGIEADAAIGHSLGELTAMQWAGSMSEQDAIALAAARGAAMHAVRGDGAMAALECTPEEARAFCADEVVIAAMNASRQTVLSGPRLALERAMAEAQACGISATRLPVPAAFHSPMMAPARIGLERALTNLSMRPLQRSILSTVTGAALPADADLRALLLRQLTEPVRFREAIDAIDAELLIEVGPGRVLAQVTGAVATDLGSASITPILECAAAYWSAGGALNVRALFDGRFTRPFDLERAPSFLISPCERSRNAILPTQLSPPALTIDDGAELVLRSLIAAHAALPLDLVLPSSRLLADLHLSSITVARMLGEASRQIGAPPPLDPTSLAHATIAEAAAALERARRDPPQVERPAEGIASWVRAFEIVDVETPLQTRRSARDNSWRFVGREWPDLRARFESVAGRGVVFVALHADDESIDALIELARELRDGDRAVIVQDRVCASAFARTLFLERPQVGVRIVNVARFDDAAIEEVAAEAEANIDFCEATWRDGVRYEPRMRLVPERDPVASFELTSNDLVLVTGGAKGIGFETALHLARRGGAGLRLIGRSPREDPEVAANLARLDGIPFEYVTADVTHPLAPMQDVTAIVHAAGVNAPTLIDDLDADAFRATVAVKSGGLRNILAAVDPSRLRLLVTFGSVIARTGLPGEAHYALANEWLARDTEAFAETHPHCRSLCIEWSAWAGVGMTRRLDLVDSLRRRGVAAMSEDEALRAAEGIIRSVVGCRASVVRTESTERDFTDIRQPTISSGLVLPSGGRAESPSLQTGRRNKQPVHPGETGSQPVGLVLPSGGRAESPSLQTDSVRTIVAGRIGDPPTIRFADDAPPLLRFLETPRVFVPGVELVADATLTLHSDRYLDDHVLHGEPLLPAVMGLEAMAQAAFALTGERRARIEHIEWRRPVIVARDARAGIRIAALASGKGVEVALRTSETQFLFDHFRASFVPSSPHPVERISPQSSVLGVDVDAAAIYDSILFHTGRFRRLRRYRVLRASECVAEITPTDAMWFHRLAPPDLLLGDPGMRDAAIHVLQACIPQALVLPVAAASVERFAPLAGEILVSAQETRREEDTLVWDLDLARPDGTLLEQWRGLRLRIIERRASVDDLPPALWGPLLERETGVRAVVARSSTDDAIRAAARTATAPIQRADGKPMMPDGGSYVSASHDGGLTLAVAGERPVGCDLQIANGQPWTEILHPRDLPLVDLCTRMASEDFSIAAARVWAARESSTKAFGDALVPLTLETTGPPRRVTFAAGAACIDTLAIGECIAAVAHHSEREETSI